jgi:ubiquinone/menaquinone biosynthesis C-methylase UbiE
MDKFSDIVLTLGDLYVSDFIDDTKEARAGKHELSIVFDKRYNAPRLNKAVSINSMFGKYWYRSGINATMTNELKNIVESIIKVHKLKDNDLWLDIACNDGTLLKFVPNNIKKLGIDPADDSFKEESSKIADEIIQHYFTKENFNKSKFREQKAKVITCIAMFYDLDEPIDFLNDIYEVLDDDGLFIIQMSYTPLMIKQMAFDNICHEHVYYWSLESISKLLSEAQLKVVDCQLNDVNGGSFRLYIKKEKSDLSKFCTAPYRDVCNMRIDSLLTWEKDSKINTEEVWKEFSKRIDALKIETVNFIKQEKNKGKKIWGYGASTKGNTLLQYFGLDHTLIDGIAERSPYKYGLTTIGTNIPIYSEEDMRKHNPDYLLVLPWHFINEFIERESEFLQNGGKFIVPCPKFEIISK